MAYSSSSEAWKDVCDVCKDAAVFIDDYGAELMRWGGGGNLLEGCIGVYDMYKDLSPLARNFIANAPYSCVVFVVTSFLGGHCSSRINHLLTDLQPLNCHVFTTRSQQLHGQWTPMPGESVSGIEGMYSHYGEFQVLLRKWINRETGVRVSVQHLPLAIAEVCPGLFTTPTSSALFPLLPSDLETITARCIQEGDVNCSLEHLGQVDFDMLTHSYQMELRTLAESLDTWLGSLNMREELFSLGYTSRLVASHLAALPQAKVRRKTATDRCSVLLVDRSLDLYSPTTHQSDTLADRILSTLSHPTPTSSDVCVDMGPVVESTVLTGSLAQPGDHKATQLLRTLVCSKQKESLMEVSRCLLDSLSKEGLSVKLTGKLARPSPAQLKAFLQQFKDNPSATVSQKGVLQLACAVVEAMESPNSKHWDKLAGIEKLLLHSASDPSSPSTLSQLMELVGSQRSSEPDQQLPLSDLFGLCVAMFSLLGDRCVERQKELDQFKESVTELVMLWRDCDTEFITSTLGIGRSDSHIRVQGQIGAAFQILEGIGECRNELKQFRHLYNSKSHLPYTSLLSQMASTLFDLSQPELSDIDFHSQGSMTNIIKSSFSLFMSSAKPHPTHHPTLVVFVVGGVTSSEVRSIQDSVTSHNSQIKVLVGGTRLVTQSDITNIVLSQNR